jgi:hypothetical protein
MAVKLKPKLVLTKDEVRTPEGARQLADFYWKNFNLEYPLPMHSSTYEYLKPTVDQIARMAKVREAARVFGEVLERELPDGPDKTFVIRGHRTNAMWANVSITRLHDGSPRE